MHLSLIPLKGSGINHPEREKGKVMAIIQPHLMQSLAGIKRSIKSADNKQAEALATELYATAVAYVVQEDKEIPLQVTIKAIRILTNEKIQYQDTLKCKMSALCALFAECVFQQVKSQKRSICPSTRAWIMEDMHLVLNGVPKVEVLTRFEIQCCLGATFLMMPIKERLKGLAKEYGPYIVKGAITAAAMQSAAPVINPLVEGAIESFKEKGESWYPHVLNMRQAFLHVTKLSDLNEAPIQDYLTKYQDKLTKYHDIHRHSLALAQIFSRIANDTERCEFALRLEVSWKGSPSLRTLSTGNSWKSRFLSTQTLTALVLSPDYTDQKEEIIELLANKIGKESSHPVQQLIVQSYRASLDKPLWHLHLNNRREEIKAAFASEHHGFRKHLHEIQTKLLQSQVKKNKIKEGIAELLTSLDDNAPQHSAEAADFEEIPLEAQLQQDQEALNQLEKEEIDLSKEVNNLEELLRDGEAFLQIFN